MNECNADTGREHDGQLTQARTIDNLLPSTLPVWDHKRQLQVYGTEKTVVDFGGRAASGTQLSNSFLLRFPVWDHKKQLQVCRVVNH
jgi:hypothetical protein